MFQGRGDPRPRCALYLLVVVHGQRRHTPRLPLVWVQLGKGSEPRVIDRGLGTLGVSSGYEVMLLQSIATVEFDDIVCLSGRSPGKYGMWEYRK